MKKYILITGGELRNKGAQAMTFVTVSEIKKRYPDKEVILLSSLDFKRPAHEKAKYNFAILPYKSDSFIFQSRFLTKVKRILNKLFSKKSNQLFDEFYNLLSNAFALIDISGYTFGSNWGSRHSFYFLLRFRMAKIWKIPFYLMPQSFGPFDFKGKHAPFISLLCRHTLSKAEFIMAREPNGKAGLEQKYGLKNVILSPDLVLQSKGVSVSSVYKEPPELYDIEVRGNSVALIPNSKNIKYSNEEFVFDIYKRIIELLLNKGKTVYLIFHSGEDKTICKKIKDIYFELNSSVIFAEKEISCIEFENNVKKFQFVVASRYHSIVHSYRMHVPAIILGWANKYLVLASKVDQTDFCFEINDRDNLISIFNKIEYMCDNHIVESKKIEAGLSEIHKNNVYDQITLKG